MSEDQRAAARPGKRPLWRRIVQSHDFVRDITVTTLGVLIALGIGEVVDEIRWKFRIAATQKTMREELGLVQAMYVEKIMLQPCITRRLTELTEIVADARQAGRLPKIQNISAPPNHGGFGDSWSQALGTETPLHMDPRELMNTATAWANERTYPRLVDRERDAFDGLSVIEDRPGPISDGLMGQVETALAEAKITTDSTLFIANQDSRVLSENGIKAIFSPGEPLDREQMAAVTKRRLLCHPLQIDGKPYRLRGPLRQPRVPMVPAPAATPS